jgi:histidyl-tRNA synthetase
MEKPTLPKGTRDFGPVQMAKRQFIFNTIRQVFQKYGFQPLETPAMENLTTLTGKYGEEGDQLLFKILNSGDFLKDIEFQKLESRNSRQAAFDISEKGLRYDLTVPFARYVVMNRHEITFPFKRHQIQPVWRADRPQKGRYREFYQCDADVVGTDSLICEAEIILMIREVFNGLGIQNFTIKINHRGILSGLAEIAGAREKESSLFVAIDKLDKIGPEKVQEELQSRGFETQSIGQVFDILNFKGTTSEKMAFLRHKFEAVESGQKGLSDFAEVLHLLKSHGATDDHVEFDLTLARGLSYYTGCIFEVKINDVSIGSVSGGGRYDNLTGVFGMPGISGVGFSFGVDRLYDAMEELNIFPPATLQATEVLVTHFDEATRGFGLQVAANLRSEGIATEVYPDLVKIKKQLEFADKKKVKFTVVIGADEMKSQLLSVKNMQTGDQQKIHTNDLVKYIKKA